MKKLTLMSVLAVLCFLVKAQQPDIKPLTIGDTVPDIVFHHVINYKDSTAKLSDFKGKLVILDFWATSCMTCVYSMPYIDSLQKQFDGEVQILLVNPKISGDDLPRIDRMLGVLKSKKGISPEMPMALFDETAFTLFPFRILPNYVWIGADRVVKGITKKSSVTAENIRSLLNGHDPQMPLKVDLKKVQ